MIENVLQVLASFLEQTWTRLASFLDIEMLRDVRATVMSILSDELVRESIAVGMAVFVVGMLADAMLRRGLGAKNQRPRERLRELELKLEAARDEIAEAKRLQDEMQNGDPKIFASALATAIAEGRHDARNQDPEAWVAPLRPALADAHVSMARAVLGSAAGEEDLARARGMALIAAAFEPERKDCAQLLTRIEQAERMGLFSEMSEADALAWRIARQETEALENSQKPARGLVPYSRGRIGCSILLSGWEAEDLLAAAQAALANHDRVAAFEAGEARESARNTRAKNGRRPKKGRRTGSDENATIEGARVVSLSSGVSARPANSSDEAEDAIEVQALAAGGMGRGGTVLMIPHGRGGGRNALQKSSANALSVWGDGGGARLLDASEREAEQKRLWERRRRPDMLGETHPRTLAARANMAYEIGRQGRHVVAEKICRRVIEGMERAEAQGDHRIDTLSVRHNLAIELFRQGKLDEAETELQNVLDEIGTPEKDERGTPLALAAAQGLAEVWSARGDHAEAAKAFDRVWQSLRTDEAFGPDHSQTLWSRARMLREVAAAEMASEG